MKSKYLYITFFLFISTLFAQVEDKIELESIQFKGNESISSSELKAVIISKESPGWFSQFLNKFTSFGDKVVYFDSLLIPSDVAAIKSLYRSNGFFKADVKPSYYIDTSSSDAVLTYNITESVPAYFRNFNVYGLDDLPEEFKDRLYDYIKVDTTDIYQDAVVDDKKNFTITFLHDHGYMLAKYETPDVIVDTMLNRVDVKIKFNLGTRYQISNITTNRTGEGKDLVTDQLLKEIVGIKPGQFYSYYDIQRAQVRLYRTELFNSALVNSVISDTMGNKVPLNITADVGLLNELSPEIIVNNEESFSIGPGLSFIKKNFLGDARKFTLSSSILIQNVSEFVKKPSSSSFYGRGDLRAIIEQPFLFGKPINTRLESYLTGQKIKDDYNALLYGAKLSLDFELPQFTYFNSLSTYFNVERSEFIFQKNYLIDKITPYYQRRFLMSYDSAYSTAQSFVIDTLGGTLPSNSTNALLGLSFGTNKTNDLFFPTAGYTLSVQFEEANSIPFVISKIFNSEFTRPLFLKTIITSTAYLPVYNSSVNALGVKLKFGDISTYRGDKSDIPLNQRLYAGGSNSVRGWATRELVPSNELITLTDASAEDLEAFLAKGAPTGGFFLFEGSIETRNRLFGKFGTALFIDYGNTWNSINEVRLDEIALAAGFGLRYYSDFAPLRIDFGIKVYDPYTKQFTFQHDFWGNLWKNYLQFHIGIGEAF